MSKVEEEKGRARGSRGDKRRVKQGLERKGNKRPVLGARGEPLAFVPWGGFSPKRSLLPRFPGIACARQR